MPQKSLKHSLHTKRQARNLRGQIDFGTEKDKGMGGTESMPPKFFDHDQGLQLVMATI